MFANKIIFITGGTGTWGQTIVKHLLSLDVKKIIIFSRHENIQVSMERKFVDERLVFVLGDVRNKELLLKVTTGVDYVIHLAALKHVHKCEQNVEETISINITGTQNIVDTCVKNNIKKALYISTDKACEPYNLYGNTKAISEKLFINANNLLDNKDTSFFVLRTGNIIGSNGSVIRIFYKQIKGGNEVKVTDLKMKRFFVDINEILKIIEFIFKNSKGGELYVVGGYILSLKSLLNLMISIYGNGKEKIVKIGVRPGEKFDETLISSNEVGYCEEIEKDFFVLNKTAKKTKKVKFSEYSTKAGEKFNEKEMIKILKKLGEKM